MAFVDSRGIRLYYEEVGSGYPIIWLHEFAADYRTWEAQIRYFSRHYRCIVYNARGYPPSDVPDDGAVYDYQCQRDDLLAVFEQLNIDRAHVVGLSMGAYTGLQFCFSHAERVSSLVFASGGSGAPPSGREGFARDVQVAADRMLKEGMEVAAQRLAEGPSRLQLLLKDPRGWEEFRRYMSEHSPLGSALTLRNFQALRPSIYDLESRLRVLDIPVLLVVGDEDDMVIETNLFLKRSLRRSGLWVMPKSGHGINLEEPAAFNEGVAAFFSSVERGRWQERDPGAHPEISPFGRDRESR